ncbi:hypothetical protein [Streptomyces boncukensis]|uniref:Uncharacterized protein n=1 Tax=Streptomyces boncukensis TaxID=2711219 RepID=A0A6G4X6H4_9ACTN|nr:hypothetical protein [Streptomyces boncukensis]NGO72271.1 hypothetical protein [Streptomyces boncukensis]
MAGPTTIDWGDGSPVEDGPEQGSASHPYTQDGPQSATVCDAADPSACTTVEFTIPFPVEEPSVTAEPDPDDSTGRTVLITLAGFPADGAVTVDWDDGTTAETVPAGTTTATHAYASGVEGEQTITATSATDATKTASTTFTPTPEPEPEPTVTAAPDESDATGRTVEITLDGFPADGAVSVDWGDGTAAEELPAGTTTGTHAYAEGVEGEQTITATSVTDGTKTASATFTPTPPAAAPTATAEPDAGDPMTASLSWEDFPPDTTSVAVDWGDGTGPEAGLATADGAGTASHSYAAGTVDTEQTITVTSEQDDTQVASATFTPTAGAAALRSVARKRK